MFAKYSSEFKHFFSLKLDFTFITSKIILFKADFKNEAPNMDILIIMEAKDYANEEDDGGDVRLGY